MARRHASNTFMSHYIHWHARWACDRHWGPAQLYQNGERDSGNRQTLPLRRNLRRQQTDVNGSVSENITYKYIHNVDKQLLAFQINRRKIVINHATWGSSGQELARASRISDVNVCWRSYPFQQFRNYWWCEDGSLILCVFCTLF
jgi:hypothetical protein